MNNRKATLKDVHRIRQIIEEYAKEGFMLPRKEENLCYEIRDFYVCENDSKLLGCCALRIFSEELGEIRSLAVNRDSWKHGVGKELVKSCIEDGRKMGLKFVFALTYVPDFFKKLGFVETKKEDLPHKIWRDCLHCGKFPNCDENAMILKI